MTQKNYILGSYLFQKNNFTWADGYAFLLLFFLTKEKKNKSVTSTIGYAHFFFFFYLKKENSVPWVVEYVHTIKF